MRPSLLFAFAATALGFGQPATALIVLDGPGATGSQTYSITDNNIAGFNVVQVLNSGGNAVEIVVRDIGDVDSFDTIAITGPSGSQAIDLTPGVFAEAPFPAAGLVFLFPIGSEVPPPIDGFYQFGSGNPFTSTRDFEISASIIPVPAAAWLFGSALGLLGWVRRTTR